MATNPGGISNFSAIQNANDALNGELTEGDNSGDTVALLLNDVSTDANGNPRVALGGDVVSLQQADNETAVSAPAFTSGTAIKNTSAYRRTYAIATATAGTATIVITNPEGNNTTLVTEKVLAAVDLIQESIPPGWSVKVTLATSTGADAWTVF